MLNFPAFGNTQNVGCNFMTTYKLITILSILTLFISCDNNKHGRQNEIKRVVFATGGCYGHCPIQAIEIDSSLKFKYHGVEYTDSIGFFVGNITNDFWDTLNFKFENINYKQLDSSYEHSVDDLSTEIYIYYNNKVKHIHGQSASLPDSVMTVYLWLMKEIKLLKMQPINDSLTFPTIVEKPLPMPPMPKNFKFVPPTVEDK